MREYIQLQVLICTLGEAGIRRVAAGSHPAVPGVEYLVSWQLPTESDFSSDSIPADIPIPPSLLRPDFKIVRTNSSGLSRNRNFALENASAPYCLLSDDDLDYTEKALASVVEIFSKNPDIDIATFQFTGADSKDYPSHPFDLNNPPKGYYISSAEIAFRLDSIKKFGIKFDERFGIGAIFPAGEEDIWAYDLLKHGLKGQYFPLIIAHHESETTGVRGAQNPDLIRTKGAVFCHIHPRSWLLRMLAHALRYAKAYGFSRFLPYCRHWLQGAIKYHRLSNA